MFKRLFSTMLVSLGAACGDGEAALPLTPAIADEARLSTLDRRPGHHEPRAFHRSLLGFWRVKNFEQGLWVDLIWVVGRRHAWHVVTLHADEDLRSPLVRWDIVRRYRLERPSSSFHHAYDLTWTDLASTLTPFVADPALFAASGIDDCSLEIGRATDLSRDNCGEPFFPFRECDLMDFVQRIDDRMTFGDPRQGDRCIMRPTRFEAWTFGRVAFDQELARALLEVR